MNSDFRIEVDFFNHPKTLELIDRLGIKAVWSLMQIWGWCATTSIEGWLPSKPFKIAQIAQWEHDPKELVSALVEFGFLDHIESEYRVHDWADHQPFVIDAKHRIERARKAGLASAESRRNTFGTAQPGMSYTRTTRSAKHRTSGSQIPERPTQPNLNPHLPDAGLSTDTDNSGGKIAEITKPKTLSASERIQARKAVNQGGAK